MRMTCCRLAVLVLVLSAAMRLAAQAAPAPTPEQLAQRAAAEKDHQRLMDLLGIKVLRHGADNDPKSPFMANYDESKANVYPNLPHPLLLKNGKRVTSAKVWWTKRRPEIVEDFDREILGRVPANTPKVTWEVVSTTQEKVGDVPVGIYLNVTDYGPAPVPGKWATYTVPLSDLGVLGTSIYKFCIQDQSGLSSNTWYIDNVGFAP